MCEAGKNGRTPFMTTVADILDKSPNTRESAPGAKKQVLDAIRGTGPDTTVATEQTTSGGVQPGKAPGVQVQGTRQNNNNRRRSTLGL